MDDSVDEPGSLPCSAEEAKFGIPVMVQLHLVNAGLEKNSHPREDFYREYSVTPERRTPEAERTPPPPTYSPGAILKDRKDWAAHAAKGLGQFHAGRVLLRKEEAEQPGVLGEDPEYWSSKAHHWTDEMSNLMREMGKRIKLEQKGEAEEGYALSMLSSPVQLLSPPPSNGSLAEVPPHSKMTAAVPDELPEIGTSTCSPQAHAGQSLGPLQPTPKDNPEDLPTLSKGQKRTRAEFEDREEESLDLASRTKRPRREVATARQKQETGPSIKSTQSTGKETLMISRINAKPRPKRKNQSETSLTQRSLPWDLRSRHVRPHSENGEGTTAGKRDRRGKDKAFQCKRPLHRK